MMEELKEFEYHNIIKERFNRMLTFYLNNHPEISFDLKDILIDDSHLEIRFKDDKFNSIIIKGKK